MMVVGKRAKPLIYEYQTTVLKANKSNTSLNMTDNNSVTQAMGSRNMSTYESVDMNNLNQNYN